MNEIVSTQVQTSIWIEYLIMFGWAIVGSVGMGVGLVITLKMFTLCTREVDEWELVKQGSIPVAIILAATIIACGIVVASAISTS
jgi:uncharacterized membrane protein YjfL (UPF0719 family)